jgi:hypothetical protein
MTDEATLTAFYRIFQGNTSFFVTHRKPFVESEGELKAWHEFAAYGTKSFPEIPEGCEKGDLIPLTKEQYKEHLKGGYGLAIAPLCYTRDKKNVCYFVAIGIDINNTNFKWLVYKLYAFGFKFAAFLSESGGLRIYFFFRNAEQGDKVVETLKNIVEVFGLHFLYCDDKKERKIEIFPKQATLIPGEKNTNCLFLPFYNIAGKGECRNKMINSDGELIGITKAIPIIENMFTSLTEIQAVLDNLPYNDAPYCIQAILLTGMLSENIARNNFLFSVALYCKKKYGEGFYSTLEEMNECLEVPLKEDEVNSVYKSVIEKSYDIYLCTKSPCLDYCDKRLCKSREYGPDKDKNRRFTGVNCWGELSKVKTAGGKETYYLWQVRVKPEDPFKVVRIDKVEDLQDQAVVQKQCWRYLNWAPYSIKQNDWIKTVNEAMLGIENRETEAPRETETTNMVMLHDAFLRYLTHKQIQKDAPYLIKVGQVYHANGAYFFTTRGIMDFLRLEKRSLGRINLREILREFGCSETKVTYKNPRNIDTEVLCWTMPETEETLGMDEFYKDIYEGDADIIRKSSLDNGNKERENGDGVKL